MVILIPCPWCKSTPKPAEIIGKYRETGNYYYQVPCQCGALGPEASSKEGAEEVWNSKAEAGA